MRSGLRTWARLRQGIAALPPEQQAESCGASSFAAFTPDNDPYGEHDFGSFELAGKKFLEDRLL